MLTMPPDKGKGKRKAVHPSERSPLLGTSSRHLAANGYRDDTSRRSPKLSPRVWSIILAILVVFASLFVSAILFLILLAFSFRPSPSELSALPRTAFRYTLPDEVKVLNVTEDGVLVNVKSRCGIDLDQALGVQGFFSDDEKAAAIERGMRGVGAEWWEHLRRWTAHKAFAHLPHQAIAVHIPDHVFIFPHQFSSPPLLSLSLQSPLLVPLVTDVPLSTQSSTPDWLRPVSFTAIAKPVASTGQLWEFAQRAWSEGQAKVVVGVRKVEAELPANGAWWAKYARGMKEDLMMGLEMPGRLTYMTVLIPYFSVSAPFTLLSH